MGYTPKHADKHTKHARKRTMQHIAKWAKRDIQYRRGSGRPIHVHGGHSWVRMGVGEHNWGWGHGMEARKTTEGHYQSWGERWWSGN